MKFFDEPTDIRIFFRFSVDKMLDQSLVGVFDFSSVNNFRRTTGAGGHLEHPPNLGKVGTLAKTILKALVPKYLVVDHLLGKPLVP